MIAVRCWMLRSRERRVAANSSRMQAADSLDVIDGRIQVGVPRSGHDGKRLAIPVVAVVARDTAKS